MGKILPEKNPKNIICLISILLILVPTFAFLRRQYSVQSIGGATVSVFPSSVTAVVDQNFGINITVSGVSDLYGWEFRLSWNASLLNEVGIVEGPFLRNGGNTFFSYNNENATVGHVVVDCALLGGVQGVSGSGTLATISFSVKDVGECPLDLHDLILLNSFEQPISCQDTDGYGHFTLGHDVAVVNVTFSPITVLQGEIVNINVTAENQGGFMENFNVTVYANSEAIGMQLVSLDSNSSAVIHFVWNTSGFRKETTQFPPLQVQSKTSQTSRTIAK